MISFDHFCFHLEPKVPLHMAAYNKGLTQRLTPGGNVIRGGVRSTFRLSACDAQAGRIVCHGKFESRVRDRGRERLHAGSWTYMS